MRIQRRFRWRPSLNAGTFARTESATWRWAGDEMWQLASCEFWRDGGSYSVTLSREKRVVSLWLQVSSWTRIEDRTYQALFLSEGTDPTRKSKLVAAGDGEEAWLTVLEQEVDRSSLCEQDVTRLNGLVTELRNLVARHRLPLR